MKTKAPARRVPMSKARASTQVTLESEPKEASPEGKKRKERVKKTVAIVVGKPSMMEEEKEVAAPAPKAQKLMGDAIMSGLLHQSPKKLPRQPLGQGRREPQNLKTRTMWQLMMRPHLRRRC